MREIKFRVWQKSVGEFVNIPQEKREEKCFGVGWLALDLDGTLIYQTKTTYTPVEDPDDFIAQQYTGLKDKNEKEIYEGDIVRSGFSTAVVEWDDDIEQDFYWGNACGFRFNFDPETMNPNGDYEVIGNIFEGADK